MELRKEILDTLEQDARISPKEMCIRDRFHRVLIHLSRLALERYYQVS